RDWSSDVCSSDLLGRVQHSLNLIDPRTLFVSSAALEAHRVTLDRFRRGEIALSDEVWQAKKVVDATIHPDTGEKVLLPFRMSAFVFSNLVVTAGMLTPGLTVCCGLRDVKNVVLIL